MKMMNRKLALAGTVAIIVVGSLAPAWCVERPSRASLISVNGPVRIQRGGKGSWFTVLVPAHRKLYGGDHVQTLQRATATILIDGAKVSLKPGTHVIIPAMKAKKARRAVARIWAVLGKVFIWLVGSRQVELGSEAAVAAASGTKFAFEVSEDGTTVLTVLDNKVAFYNDLGKVVVREGEQSTAAPGSPPSPPMRVDPSAYIQWEATLQALWLGWETRFAPSEAGERLEELAAEATTRAAAAPEDVTPQLEAGKALHDLGDTLGAEKAYRRALELAPDNADARLLLGYSLLEQARPIEAEAEFAAAAKLAPNNADALVGQAAAQASSGAEDGIARAKETLAKALAMKPDSAPGQALAGILAMREGDANAARSAFERAIGADASTYQAYAHLSVVELAEGNTELALAAAEKAVALAPASGLAHGSLATVHFFAGDLRTAREEVDVALEASPNSAAARLLSSDICVAQGDLDGGLQEAQFAVALDPQLGPAFSALGMVFLAQNDLRQAERALAQALELRPNLVAARTGMGVTYARQGKLALALATQKAAIALDSSDVAAHNNMGAIHLALGELREAVDEFETAIAAQPEWSLPHANLAIAYLDMNRFADAVREGELAVRLGEDSARVHTTLARVYLEQNRTNKAWAELRRALELDEDYALAHLQAAEVYMRQGRARDALKQQLEGIISQPSAMLESREYSRTEARLTVGSLAADLKTDGRGDDGLNSYFIHLGYQDDDWDRPHTDWERTTLLGIAGRQASGAGADALYLSLQREERDRPGAELADGSAEDANYESEFTGREIHYLRRRAAGSDGLLTLKLGYRNAALRESNPDSLAPDPKPFRALRVRYDGPLAEIRFDQRPSARSKLVAGLALSGEDRKVSGVLGTPNAPGASEAVSWTRFADSEDRCAATVYAEHESQLRSDIDLLVGGRLAMREGMGAVLRPKVSIRRELSSGATLVLLTRPVLRDDVSEISPVDHWALRDWLSPLDLGTGGFSQSYELQYQLLPASGSLLRVSGFHRDLKNYIVDLGDPRWSAGEVGMVLASGTLQGGEIEWEHWLGRDLSAGIWLRYTDSENDEGGLDIPYQPELAGMLRLDYMDRTGVRIGVGWLHVGKRYADLANTTRLGSYNLLNLRAAKQLDLQTDVFVTVENLLDEDQAFWEGYPQSGARTRAGVEYRF